MVTGTPGAKVVWALSRRSRRAERVDRALLVVPAPVETILRDRTEADRLGSNARARANAEFLGDRHLEQYGRLLVARL